MPYHHGNLSDALVEAGMQLARTGGPDAVVLRAVSRTAGVSHNAAYRHFADRDALLWAVCDRCSVALADRMRTSLDAVEAGDDPAVVSWARVAALGRAYVEFAVDEPGWFRTAFGVPTNLDRFKPHSGDPYAMLQAALDELVDSGGLPPQQRPGAEVVAWAAVHGLASLMVDGPLREMSPPERSSAIDRLIQSISTGL